jgi:SAM-dependent methyltransferase
MTFHEQMVSLFHNRYDVAGKVILEVGSDPHLLSARHLIAAGARFVLATNLGQNWIYSPARNIMAITADIRAVDRVIGEESIDGIFGINILEHIDELPKAMEAIRKVLRPNGFFLLHGHPIWTSANGHHVLVNSDGRAYSFADESNPIPPWGHLYMSQPEMSGCLRGKGLPPQDIEAITRWVYHFGGLNRSPLREIDAAMRGSGLAIDRVSTSEGLKLEASVEEILRSTKWWDEAERFEVRQVTYFGSKSVH